MAGTYIGDKPPQFEYRKKPWKVSGSLFDNNWYQGCDEYDYEYLDNDGKSFEEDLLYAEELDKEVRMLFSPERLSNGMYEGMMLINKLKFEIDF